ncbi:MAG: hypothetical protein IT443_11320 [Phycisphaeraceae bacterium]|nr:hypothetical protein [Phycisphaeraceae bacterium]
MFAIPLVLLSQSQRITIPRSERWQQIWQDRPLTTTVFDPTWVILGIGAIGLILLLVQLVRLFRIRHLHPLPIWTFIRLATSWGIRFADQWLLIRLATRERLPSPLTLVISPTTFRHHALHACQTEPQNQRNRFLLRIQLAQQRIFDRSWLKRCAAPAKDAK